MGGGVIGLFDTCGVQSLFPGLLWGCGVTVPHGGNTQKKAAHGNQGAERDRDTHTGTERLEVG